MSTPAIELSSNRSRILIQQHIQVAIYKYTKVMLPTTSFISSTIFNCTNIHIIDTCDLARSDTVSYVRNQYFHMETDSESEQDKLFTTMARTIFR